MLKSSLHLQVRSTRNRPNQAAPATQGSTSTFSVLEARRGLSPSTSIEKRFGDRLRFLRHGHGYTQAELAKFLGIDRSFISDVELGKKTISLGYLDTVAHGFNISLADLVAGL